ncbi:MAG: sulfatase-like hydrolase/transferase [Lachnospiraceae bacterium]|nr:sulfatase-like hydrolase/transferase [Lachnospiraceae bacterium]
MKSQKNNLIVSLTAAFVLGFFAPLDFYFSTKNEFWVDLYNILPGVLLVSAGCFVVLFFTTFGLGRIPKAGKTISHIWMYIIIILTVCFYIQGNFMEVPYGALWGADIEWDTYGLYNLTSTVTWIGIVIAFSAVIVMVKHDKFMNIMRIIMICLMITTAVSLVLVCFRYKGLEHKQLKKSTTDNEWVYSRNKNFNILVMDAFDSQIFCDLMSENGTDEYNRVFEDFTFYRDTACVYTLTDYSVPTILTGQCFFNQSTYGDFIEKAYSESPLFNRLQAEGWNENVYMGITLPQGEASDQFDNVKRVEYRAIKPSYLIVDYYGLVGFKYMPTPLKRFFYDRYIAVSENVMAKTIDGKTVDAEAGEYYDNTYMWDHVQWVKGTPEIKASTDEPVFHYYHLQGVHNPRQYTLEFKKIEGDEWVDYDEEAEVCVRIIGAWLYMLKEQGAYDNSVIMIMADHGLNDYNRDGEYKNSMQCPILFIKGYDEHHDFRVSDIPVSFLDLQNVYGHLLDGTTSDEAFRETMDKYDIDFEEISQTYSADELVEKWDSYDGYDKKVGRERMVYLTFFRRAMGVDSTNEEGFYEGMTEYPAYNSEKLFQTGRFIE